MANLDGITKFRMSFKALAEINAVVRARLAQCDGQLFLPHSYEAPANVRVVIADEMTRLFHKNVGDAEVPRSGVLCIDESLVPDIQKLTDAKADFKKNVQALRGPTKKYNNDVEEALAKDKEFVDEMRRAGLSRLDLTACYRTIRVLPNNVHSLRWSWGTTHRGVHMVEVRELKDRLKDDPSDIADMVLKAIQGMKDKECVAEIKKKNPRLMANIVLTDGERDQVACSGVMVMPCKKLPPVMAWRDLPGDDDRKIKNRPKDKSIEDTPIYEKSPFYFYLPGKMPEKKEKKGKKDGE